MAIVLATRKAQNRNAARRKRSRVEPWLSCPCVTGWIIDEDWIGTLGKTLVWMILPGIIETVLINGSVVVGNGAVNSSLDWTIRLSLRRPVNLPNESTDDDN